MPIVKNIEVNGKVHKVSFDYEPSEQDIGKAVDAIVANNSVKPRPVPVPKAITLAQVNASVSPASKLSGQVEDYRSRYFKNPSKVGSIPYKTMEDMANEIDPAKRGLMERRLNENPAWSDVGKKAILTEARHRQPARTLEQEIASIAKQPVIDKQVTSRTEKYAKTLLSAYPKVDAKKVNLVTNTSLKPLSESRERQLAEVISKMPLESRKAHLDRNPDLDDSTKAAILKKAYELRPETLRNLPINSAERIAEDVKYNLDNAYHQYDGGWTENFAAPANVVMGLVGRDIAGSSNQSIDEQTYAELFSKLSPTDKYNMFRQNGAAAFNPTEYERISEAARKSGTLAQAGLGVARAGQAMAYDPMTYAGPAVFGKLPQVLQLATTGYFGYETAKSTVDALQTGNPEAIAGAILNASLMFLPLGELRGNAKFKAGMEAVARGDRQFNKFEVSRLSKALKENPAVPHDVIANAILNPPVKQRNGKIGEGDVVTWNGGSVAKVLRRTREGNYEVELPDGTLRLIDSSRLPLRRYEGTIPEVVASPVIPEVVVPELVPDAAPVPMKVKRGEVVALPDGRQGSVSTIHRNGEVSVLVDGTPVRVLRTAISEPASTDTTSAPRMPVEASPLESEAYIRSTEILNDPATKARYEAIQIATAQRSMPPDEFALWLNDNGLVMAPEAFAKKHGMTVVDAKYVMDIAQQVAANQEKTAQAAVETYGGYDFGDVQNAFNPKEGFTSRDVNAIKISPYYKELRPEIEEKFGPAKNLPKYTGPENADVNVEMYTAKMEHDAYWDNVANYIHSAMADEQMRAINQLNELLGLNNFDEPSLGQPQLNNFRTPKSNLTDAPEGSKSSPPNVRLPLDNEINPRTLEPYGPTRSRLSDADINSDAARITQMMKGTEYVAKRPKTWDEIMQRIVSLKGTPKKRALIEELAKVDYLLRDAEWIADNMANTKGSSPKDVQDARRLVEEYHERYFPLRKMERYVKALYPDAFPPEIRNIIGSARKRADKMRADNAKAMGTDYASRMKAFKNVSEGQPRTVQEDAVLIASKDILMSFNDFKKKHNLTAIEAKQILGNAANRYRLDTLNPTNTKKVYREDIPEVAEPDIPMKGRTQGPLKNTPEFLTKVMADLAEARRNPKTGKLIRDKEGNLVNEDTTFPAYDVEEARKLQRAESYREKISDAADDVPVGKPMSEYTATERDRLIKRALDIVDNMSDEEAAARMDNIDLMDTPEQTAAEAEIFKNWKLRKAAAPKRDPLDIPDEPPSAAYRPPVRQIIRTLEQEVAQLSNEFNNMSLAELNDLESRILANPEISQREKLAQQGLVHKLRTQKHKHANMAIEGGGSIKIAESVPPELASRTNSEPSPVDTAPQGKQKSVANPEIINIVKSVIGKVPSVRKLKNGIQGKVVVRADGNVDVVVDPSIASSPDKQAYVIAHELGHMVDATPSASDSVGLVQRINTIGKHLRGVLWQRASGKVMKGSPIFKNSAIRDEMIAVSEYWNPIPEGASEQFIRYRHSGRELLADAISMIVRAPKEFAKRAPKSYEMIMDNIGKNSDFYDAYNGVQDILNGSPELLQQARYTATKANITKGEQIYRDAQEGKQLKGKDLINDTWLGLKTILLDKGAKAKDVDAAILGKKAASVSQNRVVDRLRDEMAMMDNDEAVMVRDLTKNVDKRITDAGVDFNDLEMYMMHTRIVEGDRANLPNPEGYTPKESKEQLAYIKSKNTPEAMQAIEESARWIRNSMYDTMKQAVEDGVISKKTFDEIVEPNKDTYATFAVLKHLSDRIPAGIKAQTGTFEDIGGAATFTIEKLMSQIKFNHINRYRRDIMDILVEHFPDEIKLIEGDKPPVTTKGMETIHWMKDGKPMWAEVDPYVADFMGASNHSKVWQGPNEAATKLMGWQYKLLHPLFVKWNAMFLSRNPIKDSFRAIANLSDVGMKPGQVSTGLGTLAEYLPEFRAAWKEMNKHYKDTQESNTYWQMIEDKVIRPERFTDSPTQESGAVERRIDRFVQSKPIVDILRTYNRTGKKGLSEKEYDLLVKQGLVPNDDTTYGQVPIIVLRRLGTLLEGTIGHANQVAEVSTKMASMKILEKRAAAHPEFAKEWGIDTPEGRAWWVRNYAGTPNTAKKGLAGDSLNQLMMYYNVKMQGLMADSDIFRNPTTRSGRLLRAGLTWGLKAAFHTAAAAGLFGPWIKEYEDQLSPYKKARYNNIPLMRTQDGKYLSLEIPNSETASIGFAMAYLAMNSGIAGMNKDPMWDNYLGTLWDTINGEFPKFSTGIQAGNNAWQLWNNKNPVDSFTGKPIIAKHDFATGYIEPRAKGYANWVYNQTGYLKSIIDGGISTYKLAKNTNTDTTDKQFNAVMALGFPLRMTSGKVATNPSFDEDKEADVQKARIKREMMTDKQFDAIRLLYRLRVQKNRTTAQETQYQLLNKWHRTQVLPLSKSLEATKETEKRKTLIENFQNNSKQFEKYFK